MEVTEAELLKAVIEALSNESAPLADVLTTQELVVRTGRSAQAVRTAVKRLLEDGKLQVYFVRRPTIDGRMARVPAYGVRRE